MKKLKLTLAGEIAIRQGKATSPMRAIKQMCLHCVGDIWKDALHCTAEHSCPLWHWRLGRNWRNPKRILSDDEKAMLTAKLKRNYIPQS